MPTERLSMRRIRQVLQLHFGVRASARVIARSVGAGRSTVQDYLARAAAAGLVWPLPAALTDEELEQLLFPSVGSKSGARRYVEPDWSALVREMKRPGSKRGRRITLLCAGGLVPDVVVTAEDGTAWQSALRSVTGGRCQKLVRVIVRAAGAWFQS
jgi:hypothetical protein